MNVLTSAAREGARLAVVTAPDEARVIAAAERVCAAGNITDSSTSATLTNVSVTGPDPADPDRRVTVTVEATFHVMTGSILGTFSGNIPLRASATMRHESF